jgi:hypothetical protein
MFGWGRKHTCKFCGFEWNYDHPCDYSCPYQKCPACDYCQDTFAMSEGTIRLAKENAKFIRELKESEASLPFIKPRPEKRSPSSK